MGEVSFDNDDQPEISREFVHVVIFHVRCLDGHRFQPKKVMVVGNW